MIIWFVEEGISCRWGGHEVAITRTTTPIMLFVFLITLISCSNNVSGPACTRSQTVQRFPKDLSFVINHGDDRT